MNPPLTRPVLALSVAAAIAGACAPAASVDGDTAQPAPSAARVEVMHNVPAALSLTVTLIDPSGTRIRLGTVAPGQLGRFTHPVVAAGPYRLLAEAPDGRVATSPPFEFMPAGVHWDIDLNRVRPPADPPH